MNVCAIRRLASVSMFALIFAAAPAYAQNQSGSELDAEQNSEADTTTDSIVVTGTRVLSNGNAAPTPLTVVGKEQLELAAPTNLADGLAQIPEFRSSQRPSSFVTPQGPTGAFLNLRGLGLSRSLILFNGRRVQPTTQEGRTDINTFPDLLVKRVDVVTGGASAAYGSDAVAGVVNFVLDDEFEGVKADIGAGISSRGDNGSQKARVAFGTSFANDRAHLVVSGDYFHSDGVLNTDNRAWDSKHCNVIPNPTFATDTRTAFLFRCGVTGTQFATGGVITSGALRGTQFLPGGVPAVFNYGTEVSAGVMVGGDGYWNPRGNVSTPLTSKTLFGHLRYDATDNVQLWVEGSYAKSDSFFFGTSPSYSGTTAITIYRDNAFLDSVTRQRMVNANIQSFTLGRISPDWGRNEGQSSTELYRGAFGFKGEFGGWTVDGSFDAGQTKGHLENNNSPNQTKLFEALDSVLVNGVPTCRSMLLAVNAGRGCVALNPFGFGSASRAALDYAFDDGYSDTTIHQQSAEFNLRGSPFSLWAGEVAFATGVTWRHIDVEQTADPLSQTTIQLIPNTRGLPASLNGKLGVFLTGNQGVQPKQSITVKEGYAEVQVPLARDVTLLKSLDVNGAVRFADYSTTGGVWSWKVGGAWEPIDGIRVRATRSRDVRAPNIPELYAPALASLAPILDPLKGTNNNTPVFFGGFAGLTPEIANTLTAGIVVRPAFLPGFSFSVDYYKIQIDNAIGTLTAQNIVNLCFNGETDYCQFVNRLSDGTLSSVLNLNFNQNKLVNKGIDFEANYTTEIGNAKLSLRGLASYLDSLATTDPFGKVDERAGVNGGEAIGTPHWQGAVSATLQIGGFTAFVQERLIGSGLYSNQYVVGGRATNSIDFNRVAGRAYTDVTLRYKIPTERGDWEIYGTINNLFDRDPPASPTRIGAPASILGTNPTLYDVIGRQFNVGVRLKFQ